MNAYRRKTSVGTCLRVPVRFIRIVRHTLHIHGYRIAERKLIFLGKLLNRRDGHRFRDASDRKDGLGPHGLAGFQVDDSGGVNPLAVGSPHADDRSGNKLGGLALEPGDSRDLGRDDGGRPVLVSLGFALERFDPARRDRIYTERR